MHEQLKETRDDIGDIIIEPEAKNTAPAILAACIYSIMQNDNPILLVTPSDHNYRSAVHEHEELTLPDFQRSLVCKFSS